MVLTFSRPEQDYAPKWIIKHKKFYSKWTLGGICVMTNEYIVINGSEGRKASMDLLFADSLTLFELAV
jgi:hypothetical protein